MLEKKKKQSEVAQDVEMVKQVEAMFKETAKGAEQLY